MAGHEPLVRPAPGVGAGARRIGEPPRYSTTMMGCLIETKLEHEGYVQIESWADFRAVRHEAAAGVVSVR